MRLHSDETIMMTRILFSTLLCCLLLLSGCASKHAEMGNAGTMYSDSNDPWESMNRKVFAFNDAVDSVTLEPIAKVYKESPLFVRYRVSNFFANIEDIPSSVNSLLQGKVMNAGNDLARFVVNSTFGILGFFDVASVWGLEKHQEDLGQTLAVWGIGRGPYIVLPLLGSTTLRNLPTQIVDSILWPYVIDDSSTNGILLAVDTISTRTGYLDKEEIARELSPDFYSAVKSFYLAKRHSMISDGRNDADDANDALYDEI